MTEQQPAQLERAEDLPDRVPFRVRAHHLRQYSRLVKGEEPRALAKRVLQSGKDFESIFPDRGYLRDTAGSFGQRGAYVGRLAEVFTRFNGLPDDYPVELAEEQRDSICDSCVIGRHCDLYRAPSGRAFDDFFRDSRYLEKYLEKARERDLPVIVTTEIAEFSNAPPAEMRVVRTTVGAVRTILREDSTDTFT